MSSGNLAPGAQNRHYQMRFLPPNDDEGWLDIIGDEKFYKLLGLRAEDEQAEMSKQVVSGDGAYAAADGVGAADAATGADGGTEDTKGAAIPVMKCLESW
uniref:Uncharacterized protein n=2 Tax=Oryza TaxID=4527 RepID=Q2R3K7_ORYSJ|nr:hypothetical protein LOC_Os11g31600 [Oryza sativa Japonica Group]